MNNLIAQFGGRRFLLTVGCGLITAILCWFAKINADTYGLVEIATVGAYIAGNVTQKIKGTANDSSN